MCAGMLVARHSDQPGSRFAVPAQHVRKAQNDIPPAVAALLAVTAIPPPRAGSKQQTRRRQSSQSATNESAPQKPSRHHRAKSSSAPADGQADAATSTETTTRIKVPRKSSSSSQPKPKHRSSRSRQLPSELVELLTPPTVDDESDSDLDNSREGQIYEIKSQWMTSLSPGSSSPPQLSSSVSSSGSSSARSSPLTPLSPTEEYFPVMDFDESDESDASTLKSASSSATVQVESSSPGSQAAIRHRKQRSESIAMYNDDPLCVAVDENGACIPAIAFVPLMPSDVLPDPIQVRSAKRSNAQKPRPKTNQELIDEECERQHQSMVAKINTSLRSLKWLASSMARHQEEYMRKDEIDHLEQPMPRRSRSAERHHSPAPHGHHRSRSSHNPNSSSKKRSQSVTRRSARSESVPVLSSNGQEIRHRSLSVSGVTARSSARALTMQIPVSERQSAPALCYTAPQSKPAGVAAVEPSAEDGENAEVACIQMQTYDVQQNCLPIIRPREPRMNGDFLRILAMELEMRRHGKLSQDFYSGKARMVLAPRGDYGHLSKKQRNWSAWTA